MAIEATIDLARKIAAKHVPRGEGSWQACRCCAQQHYGGSETFDVWPCDARQLADAVIANHPLAKDDERV